MSLETIEAVAVEEAPTARPQRKPAPKRKPTIDSGKAMARALEAVEKLEARNHEAGEALRLLSGLWLSADANRRRGDAQIALNHFDAALASLRKSLAAM